MSQKTAILGLCTETSLHAGTGQMLSNIDLPIQREYHTSYPCVYGSGVKGALRQSAESRGFKWIDEVFGPDMQHGSEHAGALGVSDARLLLLPVRSLTGHFKWVTCPAILDRWKADYQRLGLPEANGFSVPSTIDNETALVHDKLPEQDLFLEEFRFKTQANKNVKDVINNIIKLINNDLKANLIKQLVIINDDMFAHLCRYATPVDAHIAIDNETKVTIPGALWYQETLPPNTLLYTSLIAQNSRKNKSEKKANDILNHVISDLFEKHPYLRIDGNETVGMGWCKVKVLQGEV
ncbi:type III-B CRISPR module RAMP protein Cmr4 [Candidatus Marithrix sp. Canyon 246]|uniref:type III-B CRISPR module RAMP protein Cmr4 n=1 Tax=Candidatus Marithrix sp. Canyon 246 TaxID=1827136 RepID=UPI000849EE8B|nr:type III-B CRISPR module RAMP protein Cmr4 [Candidatus Marithrix sp. Canyon 246]